MLRVCANYGSLVSGILGDPLDINNRQKRKPSWPSVPAKKGLVVRHRTTGVVGKVVRFNPSQTVLVDDAGREHTLPNAAGAFSAGGKTITLIRPTNERPAQPGQTASGSQAVTNREASVAKPSRILVEGLHDAELVERIWGADLRVEGIVVEPLHGADDLVAIIEDFKPSPIRRLGILLDHMVEGTKEFRIASDAMAAAPVDSVLITGHNYVDIWQAIKPQQIGIQSWPTIPIGQDWKTGVAESLGFVGTSGELWRVLLSKVDSYRHLEPGLVGAVEELIDFVAPPPQDES